MKWEDKPKTVTLTNHEWSYLTTYILMSTKFREGEAQAWEELAEEKNPDGSPQFKNALSNAEFWREMIQKLEHIKQEIDK